MSGGMQAVCAGDLSLYGTQQWGRWPQLESFVQACIQKGSSTTIQQQVRAAQKALQNSDHPAESLKALLDVLTQSNFFVEAVSWGELYSELRDLEGGAFLQALEEYASHETSFITELKASRECADSIPQKNQGEATTACDNCFRSMVRRIEAAKENIAPLAPTRFSVLVGGARQTWNTIDAQFSRVFNSPPHQYCGCHALASRVAFRFPYLTRELIPLTPPKMVGPLTGETVAIFGCEWGSGHKMPAQGVGELCRDRLGAHVFTFNLPDDVLPPSEDPVYNSPLRHLGFSSVTEFYNSLMRERAFAIVNWTQKGGVVADPEGKARRVLYIMRKLLEVRPTFVITTYSRHNEELIQACSHLGLPLLHIATDVKNYIVTRNEPPKIDHFVMAMPVGFTDAAELGKVGKHQLEVTGPFVRTPFMQNRTDQDNIDLRKKWNIPDGKKVVVFPDTGNGASLLFIEKIRAHFEGRQNPYHCIVLCKGDAALEKRVGDLSLSFVSSLLYADAGQMEELMTMAAYGGALVGKPGGATVYEALRRGTRLLVPNLPTPVFGSGAKHVAFATLNTFASWSGCATQLPWEDMNYDYLGGRSQAKKFNSPDQFLSQLEALTHKQRNPVPSGDIRHFEDEIGLLIVRMLATVRKDDLANAKQSNIASMVHFEPCDHT